MKLSKYERETIICYNEEETTASVYTHNKKLIQKLKRLSEKYPDKVKPERPEHRGAVLSPNAVFPFGNRTATGGAKPTVYGLKQQKYALQTGEYAPKMNNGRAPA